MSWRYVLDRAAERDLRKLDPATRQRVFALLDRFVEDPSRTDVDIRKLQGADDEWALRVGSWRVRFAYDAPRQTIVVTRVLPRKDAYRD